MENFVPVISEHIHYLVYSTFQKKREAASQVGLSADGTQLVTKCVNLEHNCKR